jgi:hypothetical protein
MVLTDPNTTPICTKRLFSAMKLSSPSPDASSASPPRKINVNLFAEGDLSDEEEEEEEDEEEQYYNQIHGIRNQKKQQKQREWSSDEDMDDEEKEERKDHFTNLNKMQSYKENCPKEMFVLTKNNQQDEEDFGKKWKLRTPTHNPQFLPFESPLPVDNRNAQPRVGSFPDIFSPVMPSKSPLRTPMKTPRINKAKNYSGSQSFQKDRDEEEVDISNCSTISISSMWNSPQGDSGSAAATTTDYSSYSNNSSIHKSPAQFCPPTPLKSNWAATGTPCMYPQCRI